MPQYSSYPGATPYESANVYFLRAEKYESVGDFSEAIELYSQAASLYGFLIKEKVRGTIEDLSMKITICNLRQADLLFAQEEYERAEKIYDYVKDKLIKYQEDTRFIDRMLAQIEQKRAEQTDQFIDESSASYVVHELSTSPCSADHNRKTENAVVDFSQFEYKYESAPQVETPAERARVNIEILWQQIQWHEIHNQYDIFTIANLYYQIVEELLHYPDRNDSILRCFRDVHLNAGDYFLQFGNAAFAKQLYREAYKAQSQINVYSIEHDGDFLPDYNEKIMLCDKAIYKLPNNSSATQLIQSKSFITTFGLVNQRCYSPPSPQMGEIKIPSPRL